MSNHKELCEKLSKDIISFQYSLKCVPFKVHLLTYFILVLITSVAFCFCQCVKNDDGNINMKSLFVRSIPLSIFLTILVSAVRRWRT
jgi:hypothetical protein